MKTEPNATYYHNLTKREYFASLAMQGLCTHFNKVNASSADVAKMSVDFSDKLIEELNK